MIDVPVSGGVQRADAGTITIMVGATPGQYERIHPVLTAISPNVFHTGSVGTGHTMKLVNNLLSCTQRLLTFEGMALAAKNGIEPRAAVEILTASGGSNAFLEQVDRHPRPQRRPGNRLHPRACAQGRPAGV